MRLGGRAVRAISLPRAPRASCSPAKAGAQSGSPPSRGNNEGGDPSPVRAK